jgi:hypothetical protein
LRLLPNIGVWLRMLMIEMTRLRLRITLTWRTAISSEGLHMLLRQAFRIRSSTPMTSIKVTMEGTEL